MSASTAPAAGQHGATCGPAEACLGDADIWKEVLRTYDAAQASKAAANIDTTSELVTDPGSGIEFVIRLATALKAKPKGVAAAGSSEACSSQGGSRPAPPAKPFNPFLPPEPALTVGPLSDTHTLILNKFNVVAHHMLVITREFRSQTEPLLAADLEPTLRVLRAMPQGGLAFYNCGEHSGRSQPHKHLQVVPLPFHQTQPAQPPIQAAIDAACRSSNSSNSAGTHAGSGGEQGADPEVLELRQLPFRAYAVRFAGSSALTGEQIEAHMAALLQCCQHGLAQPVSYNAILTKDLAMMVPRRREMSGPCAINSLGFAGTMLVRSKEEMAYVKSTGPMAMLAEAGWPWGSEEQVAAM